MVRISGRKRVRKLVRWILYGTAAFYSFCALSLMALRFCDPPFTIVHLQRQIEAFFNAGGYAKQYAFVPLSRISDHLEQAVIAAEDSRFFHHYGIDWQEFQNALQANWQRGQFWRGGSTITQQLVKNLFLSTYGSVLRKALELTL